MSETTRQLQKVDLQQRHLETTSHELNLERERLVREQSRTRLAQKAEMNQLQQKTDSLEGELEQAEAEHRYQGSRLTRIKTLHGRHTVSTEQYDQAPSEAVIAEREVARLTRALENFRSAQDDLKQNLKHLLALTEEQAAQFDQQIQNQGAICPM